jgi:L-alanine-DL-glutamate epimerase-like enolase superfamily enzyme
VTSRGTLDRREIVLLRIVTGDGTIGLGEAVPLSLRSGAGIETVVGELRNWAAATLAGTEPLPPESAPARTALAIAFADAGAKEAGVPLHTLLSPGSVARPLRCNATLTTGTPEEVLAQAENWAADGFDVFKLKVGSGDDAGQVEAVRSGLGDRVKIRVDANASWSLEDAERILDLMEPHGIELAEQPVEGLPAMSALRSLTSIPLVADESVVDQATARQAAGMVACDAVTVKLSKIGSLDASLGGFLPTYLSSALDGPIGIAAAAHVGQTLETGGEWSAVAHGLATERLFETTISEQGSLLDGPELPVPSGNGLGITIDERALEAHRL